MDWYWVVLIAVVVGVAAYLWGYMNGLTLLELRYVQGELVVDEFEGLPYLAMKEGMDTLRNREYVILKVVRQSKKKEEK